MRRADQRGQIKRAAAGNHIRNCPGDPTQRSVAPVPSSRNFDQTALIARGGPPRQWPSTPNRGRGHSPRASLSPGKRVPQARADHCTRRP